MEEGLTALADEVRSIPDPVVYATLVGDRLWGTDGDALDLRACHVIPARALLGLRAPADSFARTVHRGEVEFELCSHDAKKVAMMLLKKNGCIAEQILSPHVIATSEAHAELREIVPLCASRHWAHHFQSQARLHDQVGRPDYARRVRLCGIHLLRSGEIVSDLPTLETLVDDGSPEALADAAQTSALPPMASDEARARLDDWLVRLRL